MSDLERMRLINDFVRLRDAGIRTLPTFMDSDGYLRHSRADPDYAAKTMFRSSCYLNEFPNLLFGEDKKQQLWSTTTQVMLTGTPFLGTDKRGLLDSILVLEHAAAHGRLEDVGEELTRVRQVLIDSNWARDFSSVNCARYGSSGRDCAHTIFLYRLQRLIDNNPMLFALQDTTTDVSSAIRRRCVEEVYKQLALSAAGATSAFEVAQLAFAIRPAFDALVLTPGVIEAALISCAQHACNRPNEWLSPYYYTSRDYFVSPRLEEVISALLDAAIRFSTTTLSTGRTVTDLVRLLVTLAERSHVSFIQGGSGLPSGWAIANSSKTVELWPTLSVIEVSSWAVRYLRLALLLELRDEFGFSLTFPAESQRKWEDFIELPFGVYDVIEKQFLSQSDDSWASAILFGPPGTGKTTIVKAIADKLKWMFVVITPADLAQDGPDQIINRARRLFGALIEVENCVFLLDEFDPFMLQRNKEAMGSWPALITNCMLPLISNLREKRRNIFFVATNHVDAMDDAATREGRFDAILPLWPPSYAARVSIIRKFLPKEDNKATAAYARQSKLMTYNEIRRCCIGIDSWGGRIDRTAMESYRKQLQYCRPRVNIDSFD